MYFFLLARTSSQAWQRWAPVAVRSAKRSASGGLSELLGEGMGGYVTYVSTEAQTGFGFCFPKLEGGLQKTQTHLDPWLGSNANHEWVLSHGCFTFFGWAPFATSFHRDSWV